MHLGCDDLLDRLEIAYSKLEKMIGEADCTQLQREICFLESEINARMISATHLICA
jgi:hypothetical protein